ncbi:Photosystem I chlorophyll a apoprotein A1 [Capsicum baccatum]|uniref:Photosystem I chlorophyll a apoprotein A1 n=1 Tax=Capsicum baccatum TaxID=33114 RepID=A0A2G2WRF9_CAPBA|nr:Photosystem I chlorophyll a apoprotein A1 [Capsicum baccatum]
MWIDGFLIVGVAAHAAIFMVRDYDPTTRYNDVLDRVLRHRDAIMSHFNWACIFLGLHSFGLYIHNDTMSALGHPQDMFSDTAIQLQPIFAQWIQNPHALAPGAMAPGETASTSLTWGVSDVWGSVSDQGVVTHITGGKFAQSSITINGWLHDFLWAQASQVIQSYGSSLSAYGLFFLGTHFVWAFSLMFLFSGCGYWQELIESIIWAHNKFKVAPANQPRALSIIQGHVVGVTHYLLGGIAITLAFF